MKEKARREELMKNENGGKDKGDKKRGNKRNEKKNKGSKKRSTIGSPWTHFKILGC